ncbi:tol-pal system YbgF family protein [Candidatus Latescibacterota bacterium]
MVQSKLGNDDEMVNTFIEVIEDTPHIRAGLWAEDYVYSYAKTLEMNRQYTEACSILERISNKDILDKIVDSNISYNAHYDSRLALGYNYFMSGNVAGAKKTLEELLISLKQTHHGSDSYVVSQAQQLLSSVDRAIKQNK